MATPPLIAPNQPPAGYTTPNLDMPTGECPTNVANSFAILDGVASVLLLPTTPFAFFFSCFHQQPAIAAVAFEPAVTTVNHVDAHFGALYLPVLVNFVSVYIGVGQPGATLNVGVYDPAGNLLIDSGPIPATTTGVQRVVPIVGAGQVLKAGWYFYAFSSNNTTATFLAQNQNNLAAYYLLSGGQPRNVLANTLANGALPSTLGPIAALAQSDITYHPTALFSQV
jgi:hypothetical protein